MSDAGRESENGSSGNWTVGTLRDHFLALIGANDRRYGDEAGSIRDLIAAADLRYEQRFRAQETAMGAAFAAQEKAIAAALAAVKEATERFAAAFESRMANTNEWRQSVDDKDRLFMPRKEAEAITEALKEKVDTMTVSFREQRSNSSGVSAGWAMAVGVVGLIGIIVSIVSFFLRMPK
jgi:glutamine phosphoribosylpyrophosphate amidotransferase